jgi:hypothetical protein
MRFHAAFAFAAIALGAAQLLVTKGTLPHRTRGDRPRRVLNRQRLRCAPQDVEKLNPGSGAQVIVKVHGYLIAVPPEVKPVQQLPGLQLIEVLERFAPAAGCAHRIRQRHLPQSAFLEAAAAPRQAKRLG